MTPRAQARVLNSDMQGRKILHHSIAHLVLKDDPESVNKGIASGRRRAADDPQDFVDARPNLMDAEAFLSTDAPNAALCDQELGRDLHPVVMSLI